MKRTVIFRTVIVFVFLVLALVPSCQEQPEPTPISPPTTPAPITPPEPPPTPVSPAEFKVSALSITPTEVVAGEEATVKADVSNVGEAEGIYTATLTVNGAEVEEKTVTLAGGKTTTVSFTVMKDIGGTYDIEINGQTGTFTVLKPAELEVNSLVVTPELILPGQEATVEANITNVGEAEGTLETILKVNGVDTDSRMLTMPAGAADKTSFTVIRDIAGTYDLTVDGQSTTITVAEAETYSSEEYLYSISYPTGWSLDESAPDRVVMSKPGVAALGVSVNILPVLTSLDEHYAIIVDNTKRNFPDLRELSRTEVKEDGAVVTYDATFTYTDQGIQMKMRMVLSKEGRYGFARRGEAREAVYEENKPLMDACLGSFKPPVIAVGAYTNTTHGFSITLPSGWDALETSEQWLLVYVRSAVGQSSMTTRIYLDRIYETKSAKEHASEVVESFRKYDDFRISAEREVTLGAATTGYEFEFTYTYLYEGERYITKRKVVSVIRGSQAFTIIVYAAPSTFDELRGDINQLTNSFTLEEPKPFGASRQDSLFVWEGDIVTLDTALTEGEGIIDAVFSGLVRIGEDWEVVPDIAESWDVSDDGLVYTFHLRDGVKFHDGKPVTGHDFKYSWERACDPETESRKASTYLGDIVGAKEMLAGEATELSGVRVIDDLTLEVTIDGSKPYFLGKLTWPTSFVVDRANVARGMNWTDKPNGTGPFKLKEWKKDELVVLERNDDYYLEPAKLENMVFQIFAGRRMMMYEQGEIDIVGVYIDDFDRVRDPQNPLNQDLMVEPSIGFGCLGFNVTMPPFDDPNVRRAFALALDMDKILEVSYKGNAERSGSYIPPRIPGYNEQLEPLPFDPELAKQLIAESKYGSVDNLPPIVFYDLYGLGPAEEAMIGMWQQNLGVTVEVQIIEELEEWYERAHNRELQLWLGGWYADYIDPQNFLEVLFHSQSEENTSGYSNAEVDSALEEAAVEHDEAARLKMYQDIEKLILAELPVVPLYHSWKSHVLVKPYVEGYSMTPTDANYWTEISIKPH